MAQLSLRGVRKAFSAHVALHKVDLEIGDRELIVFVGPSGCGKSTLLRMIAGLDPMTSGEFYLNSRLMNAVPPSRRGISMVFQSYALYPHMDVYENLAFGARLKGLKPAEVESRISEVAVMLRLQELLKRKPRELSGGQRQRVAIGRALVHKPDVLLLDEPLSNLDAALRSEVRLEIARLHHNIGGTTIYVTHDQVEAMTLADRIVVMNEGRVEQFGSPRELYEPPKNTFVSTFIGSPKMTLLDARRDGARLEFSGAGSVGAARLPAQADQALIVGVRPDALSIVSDESEGLSGHVVYAEYLGDNTFCYVRLSNGAQVAVRCGPHERFQPDAPVKVAIDTAKAHYFSRETKERLTV